MDFSREDRGDKPHHGLYNQGATCYLNCVLQVLFMTKDFRAAVERLEEDLLKTLFRDLKSGPARTTQITNKLGIDRVYEQRDAAEYLVKILGLTSPEASQIFHGVLTDQTKCSACSAETNFDGPFWHLPLPLLDSYGRHYGVVDGIEEFFRASKCTGENQMYCDDCDAKTDVTVKSVMKHHPEVLILLLKRFYFDYHHMTYVKNCCTVDVPCTLQIPENQMYELYAVVDHSGNLRSGHYTARIKDDERWYEFNDSTVRLLRYQPFQVDNFERSSNAYLLFYRKRNDITELSPPGDLLPATTDTDDQCQGAVQMREEEEAGGTSQDLDDTSVAVSTNENEETGSEDVVRPEGVRLPPDPKYNVEDEDNRVYARQRTPYKQQENMDVMNSTLQNGDEDKLITDNKEDMGGNADDQAEMREGQAEDDVKDQDKDSGSLDDVRQRRPQEALEGNDLHNTSNINQSDKVGDMSVRQECPEQVCVDMQRDEDVRRAEDAQTEGRESEGLRDVSENVNEDKTRRRDFGLKAFTDDGEQRNEERMEIYDIVGKEGTTGVDDRQIKHDQCIQNFIRADDRKQNVTEDDQGLKRRSSGRDEIWEQKKEEEKRDIQTVEQQERADDERAKWSVERQTKEQGNERDENILNGADSSAWQAGSAGSRRVGRVGRAGPQDNEHAVEGRLDSEKMSSSEVMRAEGEIKESPGGTLRSPEIKHRSIEEPSWQDSLLGGVSRLRLSEPCQSQGTERSSNADLFYRKGNDDCDQDITELSPPGDLLPATTDTDDQCQGAVQMREEEEAGGASQDLDDTSVAVSTNENEETGSEDVVRPEGVRLPPDPKYNVEDEDNRVYARQRTPYKQQENMDVMNSTLQNGDEDKLITDNKEDMGGNADDQAEMREGQVEDDVKDQDKDSGSLDDVRQRRPQEGLEGNDLHNTSNINRSDKVGDMSVRQQCPEQVFVDMQRDEDVRRAEDAQTEGREQSEIREASTRHFDRETESEGLRDVSENVNEDLRDTQKIGQDYGLKAVTDDREQRNEERMEIYDIVGKEGTTGVDDRQIKHDQCIQKFIRADDRKQNVTEDDQGLKRRSSGRDEIWEQKKEEEKRDVQRVEQQERADDERAKWSVERQTKEQGNERDENILNGADSSAWQAGSAESRRVGRVGRAGPQDNEHAVEGRLDSEKMSSSEVMRAEGESKESPGGTLRSPEIKHRSIEESSQQDSLSNKLSGLRLSEPCQSQGTAEPVGAQQENKTKSTLYSNTKKEKEKKRKASGHHESSSEGKKRRRKTPMCFSCIGPKNAELTSDSE
uniref:trichohyalin-like isoform X2 n=1 Tax=Scatophagus argus TaxID=75038 RepID=UPI001ED7D99C|nr:trichohyalin-like isoform X2 [Scatophagus argus]